MSRQIRAGLAAQSGMVACGRSGTLQLRTMHMLDTSSAALERQRETFRRMTPEQRLAVAAEMSDEIRAVTEAGIRQRHPDYSDAEIRAELVAILLGRGAAICGRARRSAADR
jgi:hypothetical protein